MVIATDTSDALSDQEIKEVSGPSSVNLWASCVTKGDTVGLMLGRTEIMPADNVNIEADADVIDTSRDQLVFDSVVGRGRLRLPVTVTTEVQVLLSVEPIL